MLYISCQFLVHTSSEKGKSYLESQVHAVAEMDSLQAWGKILAAQKHSVGVSPDARTICRLCKGKDGFVCDAATLDQANALELGQPGEASDGRISEERAASQINVADTVAASHQANDSLIGNLAAVAEVDIVEVLAELGNGVDGGIRDVAALGEKQVSQARSSVDNLANGGVGEAAAGRQVEDPQVLIYLGRRQGEEGVVVNQLAVGQPELAETVSLGQERCDGAVSDLDALVEIDFQDVWAVLGKGKHGVVTQLNAFVQFELKEGRKS